MLGEAGDKGHRCSIWDLLTTAGDPPVSQSSPTLPTSSAHPSHLVMLQCIQTPPQTLKFRSDILVRKDKVPGHSRPPFCKNERTQSGFPGPLTAKRPISSDVETWPLHLGVASLLEDQSRASPGPTPSQSPQTTLLLTLTNIQGARVRPLGKRHSLIKLV